MAEGKAVELAKLVLENASLYQSHFTSNGLDGPSLDASAFPEPELPADIKAARERVIEASTELQDLVRGSTEVVHAAATHHAHLSAMQAIYRYNIAPRVPLEGDISYDDLSKSCGLNEPDLRRIVRYAMSCHIFQEPRKQCVGHNGPSKALASTPVLREWVGMVCDDLWPAATRMVDAMAKWPDSQEPTEAGFNLANDSNETMFKTLIKQPERVQRFAKAMSMFAKAPGMEPSHMVETKVWDAFRSGQQGVFVDLGGSHGNSSIAIARAFPTVQCIVQDLPHTIEKAEVPEDLSGRLSFQAHDFFTEQPVRDADVYFLRWIFHDWSDKYCLRILKALVPALKPGARVVVNEFCIPEPGLLPAEKEKMLRSFDLVMFTLQNSKEREAGDWVKLFKEADSRFNFSGITKPESSPLALIVFYWQP